MPIQQMLLGSVGKEDDVFQVRVFQGASSLTSSSFQPYNYGCNFHQYSDGSFVLSGQGYGLTNVNSDTNYTSVMCITNTDATSIVKSANNWDDNYGTEYTGVYPKQGSSKDFTLFTQYGYYDSYRGTNRTDWNGRWIMMQDSLSNNLAQLYKWNWAYNGYYMDTNLWWKHKTGNDYFFCQEDYASTPTSRRNVRWGKMTITSSSISCSDYRYMGGQSSNGSKPHCFTHDGTNLYIHGRTEDVEGSRTKPFIMKCTPSGGISWFKIHWASGQNNYPQGACEVDSSGNVYYVARIRKNSAWECVIIKLNGSNGDVIYSKQLTTSHECVGSALTGSKLYLAWAYNNNIVLSEHDTSDASVNWENTIDFSANGGAYAWSQASPIMQFDKDDNLSLYIRMYDSGSVIHGNGAALFYGIPSDGSTGNGVAGSVLTYSTTTSLGTISSYTIPSTSSTAPTNGTCGAGSFSNESSNTHIKFNNTVDQQLTNINDN